MTVASASYELQKAVKAKLASNSDVQTYLGNDPCRVYDDVPKEASESDLYAFLGEDDETSLGEDCSNGSSHSFFVSVVSVRVGFKQIKLAAQAIRNALDGEDISVSGFQTTDMTWLSTSHRRNTDPAVLRQSTLVFGIQLRPS